MAGFQRQGWPILKSSLQPTNEFIAALGLSNAFLEAVLTQQVATG